MAIKYFIAEAHTLPEDVKSELKHIDTKVKYSICGVEDTFYDTKFTTAFKTANKIDDIADADTAVEGGRCWSDTRDKRSVWNDVTKPYEDGTPGKTKVDITPEWRAATVTMMKAIAKKIVEYGIDEGATAPYDASLLTDIENSTTVEALNIIYENYLGADLPRPQALAMNKYESDGTTRTYDAGRTIPSFL